MIEAFGAESKWDEVDRWEKRTLKSGPRRNNKEVRGKPKGKRSGH